MNQGIPDSGKGGGGRGGESEILLGGGRFTG